MSAPASSSAPKKRGRKPRAEKEKAAAQSGSLLSHFTRTKAGGAGDASENDITSTADTTLAKPKDASNGGRVDEPRVHTLSDEDSASGSTKRPARKRQTNGTAKTTATVKTTTSTTTRPTRLAPIFAPKRAPTPTPTSSPPHPDILDLTSDADEPPPGSQRAPIVLDASASPERAPPPRKKRRIGVEQHDAPWPRADALHVRGASCAYAGDASACPLPRRVPRARATEVEEVEGAGGHSYAFLRAREDAVAGFALGTEPEATDKVDEVDDADAHPALARLATLDAHGDEDRQSWAERYRPLRADEVLDNAWPACYLRDWMRALRLHYDAAPAATPAASQSSQGAKKGGKGGGGRGRKRKAGPAVVRAVARKPKRARRELDDFMVSEGEGDTEPDEASAYGGADFGDDVLAPTGSFVVDIGAPPADAGPVPSTPFVFPRAVRSTVLLAGPAGSGKTAAVYAAAAELGWGVHEVCAGAGRRGAGALEKRVGDVGTNHVIGRRAKGEGGVEGEGEGEQTVVLFEEVDVLFADDAGFWPALVAFIRECRRPVVLTCNDIALVPTADLPLERIVPFRQPRASLVRALLDRVYTAEARAHERPVPSPLPRANGASLDLRQTLLQAQLGLQSLPSPSDPSPRPRTSRVACGAWPRAHDEAPLAGLARAADFASARAELCPRAGVLGLLEAAADGADAEVGVRATRVVRRAEAPVDAEFYGWEREMAWAAGMDWSADGEGGVMEEEEEGYMERLRDETAAARVPSSVGRRELVLEYGPYLRQIRAIEAADAARAQAQGRAGRLRARKINR